MRASHHHRLASLALLGAILIAPEASVALTPGSNTKEVIVNGQRYEFTGYQGSFTQFDTAFNASSLPWWGDGQTAKDFVNAVYGSPYLADGFAQQDAFYTYATDTSTVDYAYHQSRTGSADTGSITSSDEAVYVNAVAVPEIDGAALAQGALATAGIGLWFAGRRRETNHVVVKATCPRG